MAVISGTGVVVLIVLNYMRKHATDEPLGATAVAKGLRRSSGAVGNCLAGETVPVNDRAQANYR